MGVITDDAIRRAVTRGAFDAGLVYQMEGRVEEVRAAPDGSLIEARVRGRGRSPYRQVIRVTPGRDGRLSISGSCTCHVGFNCKHVAAALFAYQEETGFAAAPATARPASPGILPGPQSVLLPRPHHPAPNAPSVDAPLPPDVDAWLRSVEAAQEAETEDYPPTVRKRLLYVLERGSASGAVVVDLRSIELRKDGSVGAASKRYFPQQISTPGQQPRFLRPSDWAILRRLASDGAEGSEEFVGTLRAIVATGRGRWGAWDGPALTEGEPVAGQLAWALSDDGRQRPELELPAHLVPLRLAVPWYVDPAAGVIGPVETELPAKLVRAMLASPWLVPAMAARVRGEIGRRWPDRRIPAPAEMAPPELLREPLQPRLQLLAGVLPFDPIGTVVPGRYAPAASSTSYQVPVGRLSWHYGPLTLPAHEQRDVVVRNGCLVQVVRDAPAEAAARERLRRLGFERASRRGFLPEAHRHAGDLVLMDPDPGAWIEFMLDDVSELRATGWLVEVAEDFPIRLVSPSGDFSFEIAERSGIDWFDLDLGVMVDSERVSLVPALLDLIADGAMAVALSQQAASDDYEMPPLLLPLADGRLLAVPFAKLQPILAPLLELFAGGEWDGQAGTMRLSRRDAADLALLEAASAGSGIAWSGGDALRALGRQLREHGGIPPCPIPPGFGATLRPYQEHGLAWLQFLGTAGLGGVLADDMGLGKTVQALAHLAVEQAAGRLDRPALVVCPTSLVPNWQAEAARFAPSLRTLVLHGPDRAGRFDAIAAHDLVITTYPLLARDHAVLTAQDWHVVVLDEAQTIKNPLAATSKLARTLRASQRLCLSGTPLENHLGELWSLFDFLMPGFLGDRQSFGRRFRTPIEKAGDSERQSLLARRVAPFLLRRTKAEVAPELPAKTEIAERVDMGGAQTAIYEGIRLAMHAKVRAAIAKRGLAGSGIIILDALLKLRQACCDPRLLKLTTAKAARAGSAKLDRLLELLPQMLDEGRRVLLFSQFTSMLALIEAELDRLALPYALLTGDTRDRSAPVRRFQGGEVPLFLISLKAGGVGLNLTAADTVIHYDPWWNPAVEEQATDRAHRIGQDKPVFVHRLITAGSIEEKMEALKQRKQALAAGILDASAATALTLTEGDLDMLFAPIAG